MGHRQALRHRRNTQLGITTTGHERTDAVAHLDTSLFHGSGVTALHYTSHFQARNIRSTGRHGVVAGTLQHVGPVDTTGRNADQQLTGTRHRH